MRTQTYTRRIYTLPTFLAALTDLFHNRDDLSKLVRQRRVDRAFAEKLMLVVTEVNRCRYCAFVHTHAARRAGVPGEELAQLSEGDFTGFPLQEVVALRFAQRYAEREGRYDQASWQGIVELWEVDAAREILVYLRVITFGNLLGNTFDALLSRLRGRRAANSSWPVEAAILVLATVVVPAAVALWLLPPLLAHVTQAVLRAISWRLHAGCEGRRSRAMQVRRELGLLS